MSIEEVKKESIEFFSEAIKKWSELLSIIETMCTRTHSRSIYTEGNEILSWFQENYPHFSARE